MLYLSEILQQSVWNEIRRHGKPGVDSDATLLDFYVHKGDTSVCSDAPPAPLDSLPHARHRETERLRLHSAAQTTARKKKDRDVWLLFPRVMSYPDFVYRAQLSVRVCVLCVWRTYKMKEQKG